MATPSQDLHINHTYAKESEAVGEGLLVIGSLYNVADRHNQSPPQLHQMREKKWHIIGDFIVRFLFFKSLSLLDFVKN